MNKIILILTLSAFTLATGVQVTEAASTKSQTAAHAKAGKKGKKAGKKGKKGGRKKGGKRAK